MGCPAPPRGPGNGLHQFRVREGGDRGRPPPQIGPLLRLPDLVAHSDFPIEEALLSWSEVRGGGRESNKQREGIRILFISSSYTGCPRQELISLFRPVLICLIHFLIE